MKKRRQSMSSLFKCDGSERRTKHEIWKSITHHIQQFVAPFVRAPIKQLTSDTTTIRPISPFHHGTFQYFRFVVQLLLCWFVVRCVAYYINWMGTYNAEQSFGWTPSISKLLLKHSSYWNFKQNTSQSGISRALTYIYGQAIFSLLTIIGRVLWELFRLFLMILSHRIKGNMQSFRSVRISTSVSCSCRYYSLEQCTTTTLRTCPHALCTHVLRNSLATRS